MSKLVETVKEIGKYELGIGYHTSRLNAIIESVLNGAKLDKIKSWDILGHLSAVSLHHLYTLLQVGTIARNMEEMSQGNYLNAAVGTGLLVGTEFSKYLTDFASEEMAKKEMAGRNRGEYVPYPV